jgi:outer membrane immunogenic protein
MGISAKTTLAATAVFVATISSAAAADLPVKALPPPPPGWTGPYGGIVGGYGTGSSDQTDPGLITLPVPTGGGGGGDGHYTVSGGMVGGTLGYNWQRGSLVYGIEGDLSWANLSGRSDTCGATTATPHPCGTNLNAFGTFRGRLGYAAGDQRDWLLYVTGGVAIGDVRGWDALTPASGNDWRAGWTAGLGVEKAFGPHWTAKLEYLHADLGNAQVFYYVPGVPEYVSFKADLIRAGVNYRFGPAPRSYGAAPTSTAAGNWAGWYIGGNAGYLDGANRINTDATIISSSSTPVTAPAMATAATSVLSTGNGGFIGGLQGGHNFVLSPMWLAGFEVDFQGSTLRGSAGSANTVTVDTTSGPGTGTFTTGIATSRALDYLGTIRARLGAAVTPNLLIYGTGGLAYGRVRSSASFIQTSNVNNVPTVSSAGSFSDTRAGYAVGAGGEWMFLDKWSFKAEYLHYDLGSANYGTGGYGIDEWPTSLPGSGVAGIATSTRVHFNGNIARFGLNYHLN